MPAETPFQVHLDRAHAVLRKMVGRRFDIFTLRKPKDVDEAVAVAKVISKLSPFTANVMEAELVHVLNEAGQWPDGASWMRQDPDFPDAILSGVGAPAPGVEIKMWFPLATEITARFRESQSHLTEHNTSVALLAWLPEFILYGQPEIVGVWIADSLSVAEARDKHYHSPPSYLVVEPEDTTARTRNLQQRNCEGYRFQAGASKLLEAEEIVAAFGEDFLNYRIEDEFQQRVMSLRQEFKYRLDTNFAKMDRVQHEDLERFKTQILGQTFHGKRIADWGRIISRAKNTAGIRAIMSLQ